MTGRLVERSRKQEAKVERNLHTHGRCAGVCGVVGPTRNLNNDLTPPRHTQRKEKVIMGAYYDEVEIEDMVWDEVDFFLPSSLAFLTTRRILTSHPRSFRKNVSITIPAPAEIASRSHGNNSRHMRILQRVQAAAW